MAGEETSLKMNFYRQCLNVSNSLKNLTSFEADKAVTDFMTYRRNYVNKRKDD